MDVKVKDRKKEIEYLRSALNLAELWVDYTQTDLIIRITDKLNKLGGKFSIDDGIKIQYEWKEYWRKYFEKEKDNKS